ncbi:MAG: WG repeat-containing protein [Flavobacteriales bacterium]|nr:WG repeat-containing protein [Flavobacteriales bacterium]
MKCYIKYLVLFALFTIEIGAFASRLKKAHRDLSAYNYFAAKHRFEKLMKRKPVPAAFGLSTIFYRNDNPFHQLDSAYLYILKSQSNYAVLKNKQKEKLKAFGIDSAKIDSLFLLICKKKYNKVADSANIDFYNQFIQLFTKAPQWGEAINNRNILAFQQAKKINTSDAICRFTESYPDAPQVEEALLLYDKLLFAEETRTGTLDEYIRFTENHPFNSNKIIAEEKIFILSTKDGKLNSYEDFISKFPFNPNVNTAWRNIYTLYTKEFSKEKIIDFRKKYPSYPFMNELEEDLKLSEIFFLPVRFQHKWGYISNEGDTLIKPKYQWASMFSEGFAVVQLNNKKGFINKRGEYVIAPVFDDAENFYKEYAIIARDSLYGLIDKTGKIIIPIEYSYLDEFSDSLFLAEKEGQFGYLDAKGNTAIPFIYNAAGDFKNNFAYVKIADKMGIINRKGINVLRCEYDWIENFTNGLARVKKENKFGILNTKADTILSIIYDYIGPFKNHLAIVAVNDKYGYVNTNGKICIPLEFSFDAGTKEWADFTNGYAIFKQKNKFGLIDSTGKKVLEAKYDAVGNIGKNLWVPVLQKDKWVYVSLSKKPAPSGKFDYASFFNHYSVAIVKQKELYYLINDKTEWLTLQGFDKIVFWEDFIQVQLKGKWGLYTLNAEELIPIEYEKIERINPSVVVAQKEDSLFYINLQNKKIIHSSGQ